MKYVTFAFVLVYVFVGAQSPAGAEAAPEPGEKDESRFLARVRQMTFEGRRAFVRPGSGEVLFASTHHDPRSEDCHRPTDTPDLINYEGLAGVVTPASLIGKGLDGFDERPDYREIARTHQSRGDTDSRRA